MEIRIPISFVRSSAAKAASLNKPIHEIIMASNEKAFISFYTTKQEGSGIGLSLCRQIVLAHHGHIKAESEEGNGTKITIII